MLKHNKTRLNSSTTPNTRQKRHNTTRLTRRQFSAKGRPNPNAFKAKAEAREAAEKAEVLIPHTTPSPTLVAARPQEASRISSQDNHMALDPFKLKREMEEAIRKPGMAETMMKKISEQTKSLHHQAARAGMEHEAMLKEQAAKDNAAEDEKNRKRAEREAQFAGYPKTFAEAKSKAREQPLPYQSLDPNSFKAKIGKFLGFTPPVAPLTFKPILVCPEQNPQHYFPADMPGTLVYGLDYPAYQKLNNADIVPIGTIVASLGALSAQVWDNTAIAMWLTATVVASWNLYSRSQLLTRVTVETTKEKDKYVYPKTFMERHDAKVVKTLHLEQKNWPFSGPKRVTVDIPESLERLHDPSFLKEFVSVEDVETAVNNPGQYFLQLNANVGTGGSGNGNGLKALTSGGGKQHMLLQLDQIRNVTYLNQLIVRSANPTGAAPGALGGQQSGSTKM